MSRWFSLIVLLPLSSFALEPHGFLDTRGGLRLQNDPGQKDYSLAEVRLQLDVLEYLGKGEIQLRGDLVVDGVERSHDVDLEDGSGAVDLREAYYLVSPGGPLDVKLGRQILTWGTGDLLFINDLFPKDWRSFFTGRDEEYLKAPSDAIMASFFPAWGTIDVVYVPRFDADRYIRGERLSFFQPGGIGVISSDQPDDWFSDDELHIRLSTVAQGYELALYGYEGFWKSPAGQDRERGLATFPRLQVVGASARGTLGKGIINTEAGYYISRDDPDGDDPTIRNSDMRGLVGYQLELAQDLSATLQYYVEHIQDYQAYKRSLPPGQPQADERRHVLTLRLTRQLMNQNLTLGLFSYWSPSDQDGYLRPNVRYKINDDWLLTAGGNIFLGEEDHTFFGQFENNNNLYAGARYSF